MTSILDDELLTIAEAAARLKVSKVTISRWIKQGRLPASHVGPHNVRIRARDLERVIEPTKANDAAPKRRGIGPVYARGRVYADIADVPPLTDEEVEQRLEVIRALKEFHAEQLARRGGVPFPSSAELIREMREERSRQLEGR